MTVLVFPHQLFSPHPLLHNPSKVLIIEDSLFFGDHHHPARFHKQKLAFHRATMQHYAKQLTMQGHALSYINYADKISLEAALSHHVRDTCLTLEPHDFLLEKRLRRCCHVLGINLEIYPSPGFLNTQSDNQQFFQGKRRWLMADFYKYQRKRLGLLMNDDGQPVGGKWSFDEDNRQRLPKARVSELPQIPLLKESPYTQEARAYVEKHFSDNPGYARHLYFPHTTADAQEWLKVFLKQRLHHFGAYEDAIVQGQSWLYHSVLTPMLNVGLLTPDYIIQQALDHAHHHDIPLASLEGFIRQIIGWREFMRAAYETHGVTMRNSNYWNHQRAMPTCFYTAQTGILPVDDTIQRILETGYCHHIERLMVLGGFMFLCHIHPTAIYQWFMDMFIDSYDWVMVPNVYAMSQHSAGNLITTKPYFSSSNYIRNMSHYANGEWCEVWDGLYWKFIFEHQNMLANNPRWAVMVKQIQKMDKGKLEELLGAAETFLLEL
jgi:deoxyribodipyrimidine photolyase-related protein